MGTKVASLEIEMAANIARLTEDFAAAKAEVNKSVGEIQRSVQKMQADIQSTMGKVGESLKFMQGAFIAVGAALAGGAAFKAAVDKSVELTKEANSMAKALGISATEASVLNVALGDIYQSSDTMLAANKALTKQLVGNEAAFKDLGVATRDQNGNYRNSLDIMLDVNKRLLDFKEGTDRNVEGTKIYGKAWGEVQGVLKLNADLMEASRAKAQELGLVVGQENVEATARYRAAMNDVGDVIDAVQKTIGDALMPILAELGEWFSTIGPTAVLVIKGAIGGLASVFHGIKLVAQEVWEGIALYVEIATIQVARFASTAAAVASGDLKGAVAAWKAGGDEIEAAYNKRTDNMARHAQDAQDAMLKLFDTPTSAGRKNSDGEASDGKPKKEKTAKPKQENHVSQWEQELADQKISHQKEHDLREMSLAEERSFWAGKLTMQNLSAQERLSVQRKVQQLELAELKAAHKEKAQLDQMSLDEKQRIELHGVELMRQEIAQRKQMGDLSATQEIAALRELENTKFAIELKAAQARAELEKDDPVKYQQTLDKIAQIKRQHDLQMMQLTNQAALAQKKDVEQMFQPINQAFGQSIQGIIMGTTSMQKALQNIWQSIGLSFAQMVQQTVTKWMAGEAAKLLASQTGAAAEQGLRAQTAATTAATAIQGATVEVGAKAAGAASGAAQSVAPTPFVGPALAAAAFAAVMGMVLGAKSTIPSAAGGFDIPAGVNPLTQLHEREMVLPAKHADVIRSMAEGGMGGGAQPVNVNISAVDAHSVNRLFMNNGGALVKSIQEQMRNFKNIG